MKPADCCGKCHDKGIEIAEDALEAMQLLEQLGAPCYYTERAAYKAWWRKLDEDARCQAQAARETLRAAGFPDRPAPTPPAAAETAPEPVPTADLPAQEE